MTQTIPSAGKLAGSDDQILARFREALLPDDQQALDALIDSRQVSGLTGEHGISIALILFTILIEQQKTILFLVDRLNYYDRKLYWKQVKRSPRPPIETVRG